MQEESGNTDGGDIRVLLADDHTMFREGLASWLTSHGGIEVVGTTTNDQGALELAREKKPDVVIMQVQVPFERAKKFLLEMRESSPSPKIVIVTMFENPGYVRAFMHLGVSAYLVKSASAEHLVGAIRAAVFDPKGENVIVGMPRELLDKVENGSEGVLSVREMEILLLVSRGLSNRQAASSLKVADTTVKRHLANLYAKMGVSSRGEAVRKALSEEWITIRDLTQEIGDNDGEQDEA